MQNNKIFKKNVLKGFRKNLLVPMGLFVPLCLAGCVSSSNDQAYSEWLDTSVDLVENFSSHEQFFADNSENGSFVVGSQTLSADKSITNLSRIDLAQIANAMTIVEDGDENYVPESNIVHVADSRSRTVSSNHEDSIDFSGDSSDRLPKHLNQFSFDPQQYTSVSQQLPDGWVEGEGSIVNSASGLACPTRWESEDRSFTLNLFRIHKFDTNGLDVGCSFQTNTGARITLYASFMPGVSRNDHAKKAADIIKERFETTALLPVPHVSLKSEDGVSLESPVAVGYGIKIPGSDVKMKSSLWLVKTGDWHVKARATHRQDDTITEIMAALMFAQAHIQVRARNGVSVSEDLDV